jgi:hypothetical protein
VVAVYQRATVPTVPAAPVRPPLQSYQVIEDNPTEVDGPPEMTIDGMNPVFDPEPLEPGKRKKNGRS